MKTIPTFLISLIFIPITLGVSSKVLENVPKIAQNAPVRGVMCYGIVKPYEDEKMERNGCMGVNSFLLGLDLPALREEIGGEVAEKRENKEGISNTSYCSIGYGREESLAQYNFPMCEMSPNSSQGSLSALREGQKSERTENPENGATQGEVATTTDVTNRIPWDPFCSCITAARLSMPELAQYKLARDIPANVPRNELKAKDAILFDYPSEPRGHVVVIDEFVKGGWLTMPEGNLDGECGKTVRIIAYDDPYIRGFHRP